MSTFSLTLTMANNSLTSALNSVTNVTSTVALAGPQGPNFVGSTTTTNLSGLLKGNGSIISTATSGSDYAPATSGTSILKGNGLGGFSSATSGVDYLSPTAVTTTPALVVAASNAPAKQKLTADYVCTGTNDHTTINNAIAALPTNPPGGGIVTLTEGQYSISGSINITSSNTTLEGAGVGTQLLVPNGTNITQVVSISGSGVVECKLRKFFIQGSYSDSSGDGIVINTPWATTDSQHTLEDIYVTNCPNNGIKIPHNADTRVLLFNRVHVKNVKGNGFYMSYPSSTDAIYNSCIADTCGLSGFYVGGANNNYTNCKAFYCGSTGSGMGFQIIGYNNYFTRCEAQDNYQQGFYGDNTGDATYGSYGCTFVNCLADSNGQNGGPTAVGWELNGVKQWQITGGIAMNRPYGSYWQNYGVYMHNNATNNSVIGSLLYGNNTKHIYDTTSGPNKQRNNNVISGSGAQIWDDDFGLSVLDFGASGNGRRLFGAVASTSSASVTCSSASFVSSDVGKIVVVYNDTAAGTITTIQAVNSGTSITLTANAGITTTSGTGYLIYGNDDSGPIQNALTAAGLLVQSANTTDPNQPVGSGHVRVNMGGKYPNSLFLTASALTVPAGVEFDGTSTLANVMASRNAYCVNVSNYGIIRRLELEAIWGTGVFCGANGLQAHIILDDIRVWHGLGSSVGPTSLSANPSGSGGSIPAGTYYYVVTAIDSSGGESILSNEVNVTLSGSTSSVALTWTASSGASSYRIYRGGAATQESRYWTSGSNSYTDTGATATFAAPIGPGTGLVLGGYDFEIGSAFIKDCNYGIYHWAGSDCNVDRAFVIGCTTGVRVNGANQLHYSSLFLDTCGGTGSFGGVSIDNSASDISMNIQVYIKGSTGVTLGAVAAIGQISSNANKDIRLTLQANNTGGVGVKLANCQDVDVYQLLSNATITGGSTSAITTAVAYGSGLTNEISVTSILSSGITISSGTVVGNHRYQQAGVNYITAAATFLTSLTSPFISSSGLTGATAASRYVGATALGAPTSGTFAVGDFTIDQTASIWICTTAGSPGTWKQVTGLTTGTAGGDLSGTYPNPTVVSTHLTSALPVLQGGTGVTTSTGTGSVVLSNTPSLATPAIGAATGGSLDLTGTSANILVAGPNGSTNPTLNVDASAASAATGVDIVAAAAGSGATLKATSSGSNENLILQAAGTGIIQPKSATGIYKQNAQAFFVTQTSSSSAAFAVNNNAASAATGILITASAAGSGVAVSVTSSGTNENITINALGSGTITIGNTSTGAITLDQPTTVAGALGMSSNKITNLANGSASSDAAAFGQIPTAYVSIPAKDNSNAPTAGSSSNWAKGDHAHPTNDFQAADNNYLAWAYDPALAQSGTILAAASTMYVVKIPVPVAISATNVALFMSAVGSGLTASECYAALYQSGSLIGYTADQSTNWAGSTGIQTMALTSGPFNLSAGYAYVAFYANGTTMPTFARCGNLNTGLPNAGLSAANARFASASGTQTSTPPSTLGTLAKIQTTYWAAIS